jgi:bifunctional non-homologous end joining protein LigD
VASLLKSLNPSDFEAELAFLVDEAPEGKEWVHETKYDGYRILCFKDGAAVKLLTRNGNDYSSKFPSVVDEIRRLRAKRAVLDGELAAVVGKTTDFQALQNAMKEGTFAAIRYFLFDILSLDGKDLRSRPLLERKAILKSLLSSNRGRHCKYSPHTQGNGTKIFLKACESGFEGIISKNGLAPYRGSRSLDWRKVKCVLRQEFVVGGYTDPAGSRSHFGSLLLGYYEKGELIYCGNVGTGFTAASLKEVSAALVRLKTQDCPFSPCPTRSKSVHWVKPALVAEIQFHQWTRDGILRQPSFKGLRMDKAAIQVKKENELKLSARKAKTKGRVEEPVITHPEKILYSKEKITKADLVQYYRKVADRMLPHIVNRPLSLVRCPAGSGKPCFFQRHPQSLLKGAVKGFKDGKQVQIYVEDLAGVLTLAQFGALEIHPWGARIENIEKPDRIVFDLDPAEGVDWGEVCDAARMLKEVLEKLRLKCFVKTTGGKGLHVVVPVRPKDTWEKTKQFSEQIAKDMEKAHPDRFVTTAGKSKRVGKIFIDYLRNARSASSIGTYSTRAKPAATISMPLTWKELEKNPDPSQFTIRSVLSDGQPEQDPWEGFGRS